MKLYRLTTAVCISILTFALVGCGGNKTYAVELEGNPETGYEWTYGVNQEGIIKEKSSEYKKSDKSNTPGTYLFEFEGVAPGSVTITFQYARSWEEDKAPLEQKQVRLDVNDKKMISEGEEKKKSK